MFMGIIEFNVNRGIFKCIFNSISRPFDCNTTQENPCSDVSNAIPYDKTWQSRLAYLIFQQKQDTKIVGYFLGHKTIGCSYPYNR